MNTWVVNPSSDWLDQHIDWLPIAQLPGQELCAVTLMEQQCALLAHHRCSHAIFDRGAEDATDET